MMIAALESYLHPLLLTFLRPVLLVIFALLLFNLSTLIHKTRLTCLGVLYFLFCHDKSWKKPRDPWPVIQPLLEGGAGKKIERKTIVFIRHGESTWNETFNKGSHRSALVFVVGFVPNLIKALLYEFYLLLTGRMDSWFYDSPLSKLGLSQANELHSFLFSSTVTNATPLSPKEKALLSTLRGDADAPHTSLLVSSNLRRALSTVVAAFRTRLNRNAGERIVVVPSLQEISRNPDTLSLTPAHAPVTASWIDRESEDCDFEGIFGTRVDMSLHGGNKPLDTNGLKRMTAFCDYAFGVKDKEVLIVGGHSIWFRSFFRTFLPYSFDHVSKTKKVVNGGTVAITLIKATFPEEVRYVIDPASITVLYGGFK